MLESYIIFTMLSGSEVVGVPVVKGLLHARDDSDMNQDYLFYIDLLLFVG